MIITKLIRYKIYFTKKEKKKKKRKRLDFDSLRCGLLKFGWIMLSTYTYKANYKNVNTDHI